MSANEIYLWLGKPWVGSMLGLGGLLGLPLAVYLYFLQRRSTSLSYQPHEFSVVGGRTAEFPNELEIRFGNSQVERVTATEIIIWNSGDTTIDGAHIVKTDPLRIVLASGKILKSTIIRSSRPVISAVVSADETQELAPINFDYLDPKDGFVVQIIHSGPTRAITCSGTVKGLPQGIINVGQKQKLRQQRNILNVAPKSLMFAMLITGILITTAGVLLPDLTVRRSSEAKSADGQWALIGSGLLYVLLPSLMLWHTRRRYPASLLDRRDDDEGTGKPIGLRKIIAGYTRSDS